MINIIIKYILEIINFNYLSYLNKINNVNGDFAFPIPNLKSQIPKPQSSNDNIYIYILSIYYTHSFLFMLLKMSFF